MGAITAASGVSYPRRHSIKTSRSIANIQSTPCVYLAAFGYFLPAFTRAIVLVVDPKQASRRALLPGVPCPESRHVLCLLFVFELPCILFRREGREVSNRRSPMSVTLVKLALSSLQIMKAGFHYPVQAN